MSDDELQYVKRQKVVHFGAIDGDSIETEDNNNIQVSNQYIAMDKEIMSEDKVAMLEEFERRRKVKSINVSTSDSVVKEVCESWGSRYVCLARVRPTGGTDCGSCLGGSGRTSSRGEGSWTT